LEFQEKWVKIRMGYDDYEGFIDLRQFMKLDEDTAEEYASDDVLLIDSDFKTEIEDFGTIHLSPGSVVPGNWMEGHEKFTRSYKSGFRTDQLIADARKFLGTPYLWGGRSVFGIDCSGLMQIVFKINGIVLPRDAWQQAEKGKQVAFRDHKPGDLVYFQDEKGKITHVGLVIGEGIILHASGWVKENELNEEGIIDENNRISHIFHSIRRIESQNHS
jgi:cell wall-associated NlpC family hydrolase